MSLLSYSKDFQGLLDIMLRDPARYLPLAQFITTLMNGESELSRAEREMIAVRVSNLNACQYCVGVHDAILGDMQSQAAHADFSFGTSTGAQARTLAHPQERELGSG